LLLLLLLLLWLLLLLLSTTTTTTTSAVSRVGIIIEIHPETYATSLAPNAAVSELL